MQKYLELLERYCQWLALGIGGLYLSYMAYSYLVQPPITVKLANKTLLPGEIDKEIDGHLNKIRADMKNADPIQYPDIHPQSDLVAMIDRAVLPPAPAIARVTVPETTTKPVGPLPGVKVPVLAIAAKPDGESNGTAVIIRPSEEKPDPTKTNVTAAVSTLDVDWTTQAFALNMEAINKAFQDAGLPENSDVYRTQFLGVWAFRQEKLPNGEWSPDPKRYADGIQVEPLPTLIPPVLPPEIAARDGADVIKGKQEAQFRYLQWATTNGAYLLQPAFPDVQPGSGLPWHAPGTPEPVQADMPRPAAPVVPAAMTPGTPMTPPGMRPGMTPPRGMMPGMMPGGPNMMRPNAANGGRAPIMPPGMPMRPPTPGIPATPFPMRPPMVMPPGGPASAGTAEALPGANSPDGKFNPAESTNFHIYVHDLKVQPGRTYRYKLRFALLNPLFNKAEATREASLKFAIVSPDSVWSPEVSIPTRMRFFVKDIKRSGAVQTAFIDLFKKEQGAWAHTTISCLPGDAIGDTKWSVVDLRGAPGKTFALLADPSAQIQRRDPRTDATDTEYQKMLSGSAQSAAPDASAASARR